MTKVFVSVVFASLVAACGGGGDSGPATATTSFPLAAGYRALVQTGGSYNFAISGSCGGTATESVSAATTNTTFEGQPALQSSVTQQINLTGCTPATTATTSTSYIDPLTFIPFGNATAGVDYAVAQARAAALPATVKVGDNATVVTLNVYTSGTKATQTGTRVASYVVTADTSTSAIVTVIQKDFVGATLQATQQTSYRMAQDGTLSLVSIDVATSTVHIVLTRI